MHGAVLWPVDVARTPGPTNQAGTGAAHNDDTPCGLRQPTLQAPQYIGANLYDHASEVKSLLTQVFEM